MSEYGKSFSRKLLEEGKLDAAVETATKEHELDGKDPSPLATRASARSALGQFEEAIGDYVQALELDREAEELDVDAVDDDLFDTLRSWALSVQERGAGGKADAEVAIEILERYRGIAPKGRHLEDVQRWVSRFRGRPEEPWVKEQV